MSTSDLAARVIAWVMDDLAGKGIFSCCLLASCMAAQQIPGAEIVKGFELVNGRAFRHFESMTHVDIGTHINRPVGVQSKLSEFGAVGYGLVQKNGDDLIFFSQRERKKEVYIII